MPRVCVGNNQRWRSVRQIKWKLNILYERDIRKVAAKCPSYAQHADKRHQNFWHAPSHV